MDDQMDYLSISQTLPKTFAFYVSCYGLQSCELISWTNDTGMLFECFRWRDCFITGHSLLFSM